MKVTRKQQYWLEQIEKANKSGLSYAEFARQEAINLKALYNWKSLLAQKGLIVKGTLSSSPFMEVTPPTISTPSRPFDPNITTIDIVLANGIRIHCQTLSKDTLQCLASL